jgi:flagellar basal-body rod protein FlgB
MSLRERQNVEIEPIKTRTPIKPGEINNVDIDQEMAETARTQLYYAMLAKRMKNKFQKLTMGINGRT